MNLDFTTIQIEINEKLSNEEKIRRLQGYPKYHILYAIRTTVNPLELFRTYEEARAFLKSHPHYFINHKYEDTINKTYF